MLGWLRSMLAKILVIVALVIVLIAILHSGGLLPSVLATTIGIGEGFVLTNWLWTAVLVMAVAAVADPETFKKTVEDIVDGVGGVVTGTGRALINILPPWMWALLIGVGGYVLYQTLNKPSELVEGGGT